MIPRRFRLLLFGASRPVLPPPGQTAAWLPDFTDWWGGRVEQAARRIVNLDGKCWFVKYKRDPEELARDRLAGRLGRGWTNIADVRPVTARGLANLRRAGVHLPAWAAAPLVVLVRLAQDCTPAELPCPDLDAAAAAELVFSLWIRRRDTHAANRAYTGRIPVFFDHQTALLGEPGLADLDAFFHPGPDAGFAGRWRVEIVPPDADLTTAGVRAAGRSRELALHPIRSRSGFEAALRTAAANIQKQKPADWLRAARTAGFGRRRARAIVDFLAQSRADLAPALARLLSTVYRDS